MVLPPRLLLVLCLLPPVRNFGQTDAAKPLKTTICEIAGSPGKFNNKLVEVRALVESGVDDLPAGVEDEKCAADVKFLTPADAQFARLLKSKEFRKLTKDVKKNPVVEATVTGWFKRTGTEEKPEYGLALDSVEDVVVKPQPRPARSRSGIRSDN